MRRAIGESDRAGDAPTTLGSNASTCEDQVSSSAGARCEPDRCGGQKGGRSNRLESACAGEAKSAHLAKLGVANEVAASEGSRMSRRRLCAIMTFVSEPGLPARSSTEALQLRLHPLLAIVEVSDVRLFFGVTDDARSQVDACK